MILQVGFSCKHHNFEASKAYVERITKQVLKNKLPAVLVIGVMSCLIIIAARPNLGRVVIALATISITLGGILKWLSKINNPPPKRPSRPS